MFDDEFDDDSSSAASPLHPDDRLWRHPSEVGASTPVASGRQPTTTRIWAVALLAGLTGAAVALTTLVATGTLSKEPAADRSTDIPPVTATATPISARTPTTMTVRGIARQTAAVMANIVVVAQGTQRRGSGLVLSADGALLTSEALVRKANSVTVTMADGRVAAGSVVGTDPYTGLAVVKVPMKGLRAATLDRGDPVPGDPAVIVTGAAAPDEESWVSSGVVSSVNGSATSTEHTLSGLIETDRPVPLGADGGALVAADGDVSGLCLALDDDRGKQTAGYAVPIGVADAVAGDLLEYGHARRTWLGVEGDDLDAQRARKLGVAGGTVITAVTAGSPAAAGGLLVGDVLVALGDHPVRSMDDLLSVLPQHRPDQHVTLTVYRKEARTSLEVTLGERP